MPSNAASCAWARPDKGYTLGSPAVWRSYLAGAEITAGDDAHPFSIALPEPMADLLDILAQAFIVSPAGLDAPRMPGVGGDPLYAEAPGQRPVPAGGGAGTDSLGFLARFAPSCRSFARPTRSLRIVAEPDRARRLEALCKGEGRCSHGFSDFCAKRGSAPSRCDAGRCRDAGFGDLHDECGHKAPLRDPRLRRRAVTRPRQAGPDHVSGGRGRAFPLQASSARCISEHRNIETPLPDPEAAQALIAQAWPEGSRIAPPLDCPTSLPEEAEALAAGCGAQLARLDIDSTIRIHHDREAYAAISVRRKDPDR